MTRLQSIPQPQGASQPLGAAPAGDAALQAAEARVRAQEAHVLRLIVQGAPTQFAEDILRELTAAAEALKRQRGFATRE